MVGTALDSSPTLAVGYHHFQSKTLSLFLSFFFFFQFGLSAVDFLRASWPGLLFLPFAIDPEGLPLSVETDYLPWELGSPLLTASSFSCTVLHFSSSFLTSRDLFFLSSSCYFLVSGSQVPKRLYFDADSYSDLFFEGSLCCLII